MSYNRFNMNSWLIALLSLLGFGLLCLLYGFWIEPRWVKVRKLEINISNDHPARNQSILFFSDLHVGAKTTPRKLQKQMRQIAKLKADAILFGGDLVEEKTPLWDESFKAMVIEALSSLWAPHGKWAIFGNHDVEAPRYRLWTEEVLQKSGFVLLENEAISLLGIPVWGFGNTHHTEAYFDEKRFNESAEATDDFKLYLVHESDWFPTHRPAEGPGLVLCGHSHYGQVTLFGLPLIRPKGAKKYWRGRYSLAPNLNLLVSAGLGTVHIHARFFARPDVIRLSFKG
jgi:predicted MPP superfamily phosphohydrolase